MTISLSTTTRNNRLDEIAAGVDGGAGAAILKIYSGTRPSNGGAETTILTTHTMSDPAFQSATGGTLTANAIGTSVAVATGTASWFRIETSAGTQIIDGDVGTSGADLILPTTSISTGVSISISSMVLTDGNA